MTQLLQAIGKPIADRIEDQSFQANGPLAAHDHLTGKPVCASLGDPRLNTRCGSLDLKCQQNAFRGCPSAWRVYNRSPTTRPTSGQTDCHAEEVAFTFIALRAHFR